MPREAGRADGATRCETEEDPRAGAGLDEAGAARAVPERGITAAQGPGHEERPQQKAQQRDEPALGHRAGGAEEMR